jgi:hypothetical protein
MAGDEGGITDEDFHDAVQEHKINLLQEHKINILQYINTEIMYISFISFCGVEPALQTGYCYSRADLHISGGLCPAIAHGTGLLTIWHR